MAKVGTALEATRILSAMLDAGRLSSKYEEYLEWVFGSDRSFYRDIMQKDGEVAAKEALAKWEKEERGREFAASIAPIVRGMMAVAYEDVNNQYIMVVDNPTDNAIPIPFSIRHEGTSQRIILLNPQVPGCGCNQPTNATIFGIHGNLGLKAIILTYGTDKDRGALPELGLILPYRGSQQGFSGFTTVIIDPKGRRSAHTVLARLTPYSYLCTKLGIQTDPIIEMRSSGGHFDDHVGFPGATDYLAINLPALGKYLEEVAEKLGPDHRH